MLSYYAKEEEDVQPKQQHCHVIPRPRQIYVHVLLCISPFPPHVKLHSNLLCLYFRTGHGGFVLIGTHRRPCAHMHACRTLRCTRLCTVYMQHRPIFRRPAGGDVRVWRRRRHAGWLRWTSIGHWLIRGRMQGERVIGASSPSSVAEQEAPPQVFAATSVTRRPVS